MGKLLMYFYLSVSVFCFVNAFYAVYMHQYPLAMLSIFLLAVNLIFFTLFKKEQPSMSAKPQLRLINSSVKR
ncbi:hypothetical protein LS684_02845 [Cytobacillus spongiae]|uniref:hypothetical protein n=1 Tax=Cytobacillus spongiae TaxID=2901381 RepID=UPI001F385838|nr:hypothetical protein [Cytobacillus spongiae]UII56441.1 hypothetical protein LS684_02845 [Cytobacillus spongiae]